MGMKSHYSRQIMPSLDNSFVYRSSGIWHFGRLRSSDDAWTYQYQSAIGDINTGIACPGNKYWNVVMMVSGGGNDQSSTSWAPYEPSFAVRSPGVRMKTVVAHAAGRKMGRNNIHCDFRSFNVCQKDSSYINSVCRRFRSTGRKRCWFICSSLRAEVCYRVCVSPLRHFFLCIFQFVAAPLHVISRTYPVFTSAESNH
jgi:hypothetical protein